MEISSNQVRKILKVLMWILISNAQTKMLHAETYSLSKTSPLKYL